VINDKIFHENINKYIFLLFTHYQPAINYKLNELKTSSSMLAETIKNVQLELIENQIYEEILDYTCKYQDKTKLFIPESDILFKIEGIKHSFDTNKIFDDITIDIPKNKWVCFYGNSGCGKSTLCNILLKKLIPDRGVIKYMGEYSDYNYTNIRDSVSFLNPDPDLFNDTIFHNVTYGLKELDNEMVLAEVMEIIHHYLELFDLSMYKNNLEEHIESLSTGEKQRIKIIRLIHHDKPIWILDEITSNIDNDLEKVVLGELKRIQIEKNKSVIHITHNMENISFSDKKMYIKHYNIYNA